MKAFTLAEMLLVLVLLSIATALTLPNLSKSFNQVQLQNSANTLSFTMKYAQSLAITKNKQIRLLFDPSYKTYQLCEINPDPTIQTCEVLKGRWGKKTPIPSDIVLTSPNTSVDFMPNGQIEKIQLRLCQKANCLLISTQEQRGQIEVLDVN